MNKLITIIGPSGVAKTALVQALTKKFQFETALEQHVERPFQALAKEDARYIFPNQMDYLLLRAEQEKPRHQGEMIVSHDLSIGRLSARVSKKMNEGFHFLKTRGI
ncbi:MAG: hypothetical protein HGA79_07025 [Anaerolineales bacterium]|nr:hypothetical protein [Anaerolineales bacterium]